MADTSTLTDSLKRALRARRINYSQVAQSLELSEASVKRLFSKGGFTLERFEQARAMAEHRLAVELDHDRSAEFQRFLISAQHGAANALIHRMPQQNQAGIILLHAFQNQRRIVFGAVVHRDDPGNVRRQPLNHLCDVRRHIVAGNHHGNFGSRFKRFV